MNGGKENDYENFKALPGNPTQHVVADTSLCRYGLTMRDHKSSQNKSESRPRTGPGGLSSPRQISNAMDSQRDALVAPHVAQDRQAGKPNIDETIQKDVVSESRKR